MTCDEARECLIEVIRPGGKPDAAAEEHSAACADCAGWLETQRAIRGGLQGLSESMGEPRPHIEAALRARFRAAARGRKRARWPWAAAAALAAGIALGVWFGQQKPVKPEAGSPARAAERAGEFFLLDYGRPTPGLRAGRLVRVTLPPSAPAWFGLPVDPAASEGIEAEVLLGEDGVAQAVRLVHSSAR